MIPLMFASPFHAIVFWTIYLYWASSEALRMRYKRTDALASERDYGSKRALIISVTIGLFIAYLAAFRLPEAALAGEPTTYFWLGIFVMLAGIALRVYAVRVLGTYFTGIVTVSADQPVITAGPYAYIRHPSYTGGILTMIGVGLALSNWVSLAAIVIAVGIGYGYRIHVEERILCETLGQPYIDYMSHTHKLIPFVL